MNWRFWKRTPEPALPATDDPQWERALINRMATEFLRQQRRSQRWGLVFKAGILLYLLLLAVIVIADGIGQRLGAVGEHTAVVDVDGMIAADTEASADRIVAGLRKAFEADNAKGVILRINSPGGSPVQAGYVYDEIRRLRKKYPDKPVYAVAADLCASGAYYIAAAADKIYVDKATLIGSIGVRMDGFGFQKAMEELGIQRRLLTAGQHKGILDPFSPLSQWDKDYLQGLLDQLHQQFINAVKEGRGERLADDDQLFSGLFWTGEQSVALGLSDGIGSTGSVARDVIGADETVEYTQKRDLLERFADRVGTAFASTLVELTGLGGASLR